MAEIYDFPFNVDGKLAEVRALLHKNYLDQAICILEEGLNRTENFEWRKLLLTCYISKEEFEAFDELISELKALACLDLSLAAHDIVASLLQGFEAEAEEKRAYYEQQLRLTGFGRKNLLELVIQLQAFYQDERLTEARKKLDRLLEAQSFESSLAALAGLQELSPLYLEPFRQELEQFFLNQPQPILKTMLFELLARKELSFDAGFGSESIKTELGIIHALEAALNQAIKEVETMVGDEARLELEQALFLFYQWLFPYFKDLAPEKVAAIFAARIDSNFPAEKLDSSLEKAKIDQWESTLFSLM
jgi:hypothetical protein